MNKKRVNKSKKGFERLVAKFDITLFDITYFLLAIVYAIIITICIIKGYWQTLMIATIVYTSYFALMFANIYSLRAFEERLRK